MSRWWVSSKNFVMRRKRTYLALIFLNNYNSEIEYLLLISKHTKRIIVNCVLSLVYQFLMFGILVEHLSSLTYNKITRTTHLLFTQISKRCDKLQWLCMVFIDNAKVWSWLIQGTQEICSFSYSQHQFRACLALLLKS